MWTARRNSSFWACRAAKSADLLSSIRYLVLRFWTGDVLSRTDSVIETIYEALYRFEMEGRFG